MLVKTRFYEKMSKVIRPAGCAGSFYSKQKAILEREVAVFLENSSQLNDVNEVYGLIAPNDAQYVCGGVAARAYRQIIDHDFEYVVIISPSHHTYFEEISIYNGNGYQTPLGTVKTDKEMIEALCGQHEKIIASELGHEPDEHGIEIQLPFLQQILYDFKLIPIVMGNQDSENIQLLTDALLSVFRGKSVLFVASTNLSSNHSYQQASTLDKTAINLVNHFDNRGLEAEFQSGVVEMSGGGAAITVMNVSKKMGADKAEVVLYRNSGDMANKKEKVTGYLAAVFYS
ncbi:MAG TPA: AmmeMemoRadiSam system protein B [Caldithrix abyssi]|uniref:AmmeMemoRadiSam system protein B n=1 Tax=Caldithrix abyssi TaxID=187145 RepID=A0A7V1LMB5_CALAY|nr:AmmeMemoRadiSam system protein B [Caldithrix abyssi]